MKAIAGAVLATALVSLAAPARARPVVYFPETTIRRIREKVARYDWAREMTEGMRASADAWSSEPIAFPEGPTGWYHDYFCPDHGERLTYDPQRPHEHVCPTDGKALRGPKLDAYWVTVTVNRIADRGREAAFAYMLTGDEKYAKTAAGILSDFASYYQRVVSQKKPPRLKWQSLDEATYILGPIQAYELIYDSPSFTPEQRRNVEDDWLRPTGRFLMTQRRTIHNIHCWYNAAILTIGLALGDEEMVTFALEGPNGGFRQQIAKGVMADGYWFEGSYGYHFYTLSALENFIFPALNNDLDIAQELSRIETMYLAPLQMATAEFSVPPTNDSGRTGNLLGARGHYEAAAALFPEQKAFTGLLARAYKGQGRTGREALMWGPTELPKGGRMPRRVSRDFSASGLAVLRQRRGKHENYLMLDYGPHGGGHGHPDKLNLIIAGLGQILAPDPGSAGYGMPLHGRWYKQTLSHNTIVVDGKSQQATTGKLVAFETGGPVQVASATAGEAYPGVSWQRTVWLAKEGYFVVLDTLESDDARQFDWVFHNYGQLSLPGLEMTPAARDAFGTATPYQVPGDVASAQADGDIEAVWQLEGEKRLRLVVLGAPGTTVFSAVAPGNPARIDVPMIVVRRRGTAATFAAVIEPTEGPFRVQEVHMADGAVEVRVKGRPARRFAVVEGQPVSGP